MPSRADLRRRAEGGLRATAYAALALAFLLAFRARAPRPRLRTVSPSSLAALLADVAHSADSVALSADSALDPVHRDWLAAHRAAGRSVRWAGAAIPATAIAVEPLGDPGGGDRVLVAAPPASNPRLADSAGALDSARSASGGASFLAPGLVGAARAIVARQSAHALRLDSVLPRRVVVFGRPGWEAKFVVAALEERGWTVDARFPLAPDTATVQGSPARLDTAQVAAVVALDASAEREAARIAEFVRQGGGLVLGPGASAGARFAALRVGPAGARVAPTVLEVRAGDPRRALPVLPVERPTPDAIALERRDGVVAVAARRVGPGRVIEVGYEDTWRWRMTGPEGAVEAHRRWWSGLVASAAYRATLSRATTVEVPDAPLARMVATLGPPDTSLRAARAGADAGGDGPAWWLCALALAALVTEWGSRRLRGLA
ncbi:MAG: hypothetical protein HYX65_11485 [Gemmatimonadetes bacterium]|nr:hypothetical protein [Gemmatimonadota bacterium]